MGDMADALTEQGLDAVAMHDAGLCDGPCQQCDEDWPAHYWIRFTHYECVICGREYVTQERITDAPKPRAYCLRHVHKDRLCGDHA